MIIILVTNQNKNTLLNKQKKALIIRYLVQEEQKTYLTQKHLSNNTYPKD
jgi:hypothetical protein